MSDSSKIFLIGPMGAGKSTIGRRLARALGLHFIDCDKELEYRTGASIPLIFELEGEAGFRIREQKLLAELVQENDIVLATGGGVVLNADNRCNLTANGYVIYLQTSVDEQLRRVGQDPNRPLLQTDDPRTRLETLLQQRDPLYREIADLIIATDSHHIRRVVGKILLSLQEIDDIERR